MYLTYNVRDYFESIVPLDNKKILDFGCNHANFLLTPFNGTYVGLDIDKDIIDRNKSLYTNQYWVHYKNYNFQYNNNNMITREWPLLDTDFDYVLAFSVFTHTDFLEFSNTVDLLKKHIKKQGSILSTFISTQNIEIIKAVLNHRINLFTGHIEEITDRIHKSNISYVAVNLCSKQIFVYENIEHLPPFSNDVYFLSFYNDDWLQDKLKGTIIDVTYNFDDIRGTQKCLKLSIPH